jgi:hypothetical protein
MIWVPLIARSGSLPRPLLARVDTFLGRYADRLTGNGLGLVCSG